MNSILFSVLDCEFVASGWFNTLRKFQKIALIYQILLEEEKEIYQYSIIKLYYV